MENNKPERKPNRLGRYDYSTNNRYFLTICTKDKKKLLSHIISGDVYVPAHVFLTDYGKIVNDCIISSNKMEGITVENYVIMPNHVHILLKYVSNIGTSRAPSNENGTSRAPSPTNAMIPHYISTLKRFVNAKIGFDIWQRSYYDHIIRNDIDYKSIWEYIDNNPAKWTEDKYYI